MPQFVVRDEAKPDQADRNQELVEEVFAELAEIDPGAIRYITFRLADGVTFVHIADVESDDHNPLAETAAFKEFQAELAARCVEQPDVQEATLVGSYRF